MKRGLSLAGMLVTLAGGGCATVQPIAPDPTNATLVPGTQGCHLVVRGDSAAWWTAEYGSELQESDRAGGEKPAHVAIPLSYTATDLAAGFGSVWVAAGSTLTRIDPRSNTVAASISAVLDPSAPPNRYAIGHMAIASGTLWALAFRSQGSFWNPTAVQYTLLTIDMDTNAIRATRQLGAGADRADPTTRVTNLRPARA